MSLCVRKPTIWVPKRSDTNRTVQSQKMEKDWKFWIKKVEELYYPCSENNGADQLRSYCEADLWLCFRLCKLFVFPCGGSYLVHVQAEKMSDQWCLFTQLLGGNREQSISFTNVFLIAINCFQDRKKKRYK